MILYNSLQFIVKTSWKVNRWFQSDCVASLSLMLMSSWLRFRSPASVKTDFEPSLWRRLLHSWDFTFRLWRWRQNFPTKHCLHLPHYTEFIPKDSDIHSHCLQVLRPTTSLWYYELFVDVNIASSNEEMLSSTISLSVSYECKRNSTCCIFLM
jgi:hypothetical protein